MKEDISILINSCDKYSDVWEVFFPLFFRYWPDCPWQIYLGSNSKTYNHPRVINISVGDDLSWADSAKKMVESIPTENFLFFLDDFFIFWKVNTDIVGHFYDIFKEIDANCLRLRNSPEIDNIVPGYLEIVERPRGEFNRVALDIAFWKKSIFLLLLKPGESPWQMENEGSKRSIVFDKFYTSKEWIIERRNGLEAGKWLRYNLDLLKREEIAIPSGHPVLSRKQDFFWNIRRTLYKFWIYRLIRRIKTKTSNCIKKVISK